MSKTLAAEDARQSLGAHVAAKGAEIFAKYGPRIGWKALMRILEDRSCVRYPCVVKFDSALLLPGEFAQALPRGEVPEDGFTLYVHPWFMAQLETVPALVLYQLVLVNYGEFASAEDAETFGANALGLDRETYYRQLCEASDHIAGDYCAAH